VQPLRSHGSMISVTSSREYRSLTSQVPVYETDTLLSATFSVGGGSAMDTAKAANLFTVYRDADLFDFINAPIGKGLPIEKTLRPLIAGQSGSLVSCVVFIR